MANRYWIGGSGNWSNTAHWSATSGGTGGATVPTSADAVFFNSSSFSSTGQIVHLDAVVNCLSMNWTGSLYFPTLEGENGSHIYVNSNTTFITNMYITGSGWDFKIVTYGGTANIDFANISMQANVSVNGADSSGIINFTNGFTTTGNITIYNGTTNFSNGIVISCAKFTSNNTANTRIINMNSSSVTITDQLYFNSTNLTFSCGTSTITLSGSSSQYFAGQTYYGLILQNTVTFLDVFNCTNLTLSAGKTYSFLADSTYNVTTLNGNGSSITGNIVIKSTTSGTQSKINLTNETTKSRYDAKDINFSSAQLILAYSTNSGNNKNILFKLSFDNLYTYTQPLKYRLTLKKTDGTKITTMPEAFDIEYTASLKDTDTFCFSLPFETDGKENENLKKIYVDYLVFVEMYSPETGLVFMENNFLITKIDNKQDSNKYIKNIECSSLEIQLNRKLLKSYTGTKVLYRSQSAINSWVTSETYPTRAKFIDSGILNVICQLNPSWSIDEANIDSDIASLARYLDVDGENCLYFLLNTVQTSFMCLLYFDTITKKISAKNLTHIGTNRGFFISNHNIITSHTQEINSEDVITRYTIYGKDELTIRSVNPTGEEYVLDLSYYRNTKYMSQSLLDALTAYDSLIASKQTEFSTLLAQLNTQTSTLSTQKSALTILEADLKVLNTELNTLMATNSSLTAKKAAISAKETAITSKEAEITTSNTNITNTNNLIEALQTTILISNNFTSQQISELDPFIKDRDSTDDTITTASELYDEAKTLLAKINQPSINFDISIVDLFNIVELQTEWQKVSLGDIGSIRHDAFSNDIVQLRLIGYTHNYTNNELTLSFGNRNNLNAESMLLEDLKTTISNTTTLDIQKYKTLDYYENDKSAINSYISGTLDLGAQTATAGSNNEVTIDNRGITLSNPSDPQKMIRLMYNGAYLTTDGFATAKWALTSGGLNAEAVRGILGEFCTVKCDRIIINDNGTGLSEIGIKMTHAGTGNYTNLDSAGLLRYTSNPNYTYTATGIANSEDFTTNNSRALLETAGWVFSASNISVTSGQLTMGRSSSNRITDDYSVWARVTKSITKDDTTFSFTYSTGDDTHTTHYVTIDGKTYTLPVSTTPVTWSASANSLTITEGIHSFQWLSRNSYGTTTKPYNVVLNIDNIVFESNKSTKEVSSYSASSGSSYNYLTASGSGSTGTMATHVGEEIPQVWIQLPEAFKGKSFVPTVFLQDSGSGSSYAIGTIKISVVETDITNARFKVEAYIIRRYYGYNTTAGNYTDTYATGCDFAYVATI